jgi:hypothetical protein
MPVDHVVVAWHWIRTQRTKGIAAESGLMRIDPIVVMAMATLGIRQSQNV